ncbi:MAG: Gfo/Idh/MocA family oxidoreductase [Nitrospirota bacterium]
MTDESETRTGVIGVGYLGQHHARIYSSMPGVKLVGVADINKERADEIARAYSTTPFYDYRELIGKVDAVSIVVPTVLHHKVAMDLISNDVDILLEKPITTTIAEAEELIREAEGHSLILQIGHLERFNAAMMALASIIKGPRFIESHRLGPFIDRGTDVSVILDLMIHDIDILLSLVASEVEEIRAVGVPVLSSDIDIANARIEFKSGCVANVTASRISKEKMRKIRIFQEDAYISLDYQAQELFVYRKAGGDGLEKPKIAMDRIEVEKGEPLQAELTAFIDSVRRRTRPLVSGHEGKEALRVALKVLGAIKK